MGVSVGKSQSKMDENVWGTAYDETETTIMKIILSSLIIINHH